MPTYHACGVTANLKTRPLTPTLSRFTDLRMGGEQKKDAIRIQKELAAGEKLGECVIGPDESEKGVVRFIGAHGDMPLYVVEASKQLRKKTGCQKPVHTEANSSDHQEFSDSPLTSLGVTPTPTQETFKDTIQVGHSILPKPRAKSKPQSKSKTASRLEHRTLEQALQNADNLYDTGEQALVLDLQLGQNSFLPARNLSASLGKDLKVEIFMNGELVEVLFINARRSAAQLVAGSIRFAGTRVHRQTEKPWAYRPDETAGDEQDAQQRWFAVSNALAEQARLRGTDHLGELQPSADFLSALATMQLPERLKSFSSLGVLDLIITGGKGQKYGPDTAYNIRPTLLDDPEYIIRDAAIDPSLSGSQYAVDIFDGGAVISPPSFMNSQLPETSPEIPLKATMRGATVDSAFSSPIKKTMSLAEEFGLAIDEEQCKKLKVGSFDNARNRRGPEGYSLLQRLGDLKKMNETNQIRELEKLKEDFSDVFISSPSKKQNGDGGAERPVKRLRTNSDANYMDPMDTVVDPALMEINHKMQDDDVFGAVDPKAVLTQNRIDMALDSGAASNGALLRRIASTSPVKTPRKTKAAALAYSPTRTAIKEQRSGRAKTQTPQKRVPEKTPSFDAPTTPQGSVLNVSPSKSGRGANRTASKWLPNEASFQEALDAFRVPEVCKGSCVTYSGDRAAMRQIGKARGGTFREDEVVVGMRFLVW